MNEGKGKGVGFVGLFVCLLGCLVCWIDSFIVGLFEDKKIYARSVLCCFQFQECEINEGLDFAGHRGSRSCAAHLLRPYAEHAPYVAFFVLFCCCSKTLG